MDKTEYFWKQLNDYISSYGAPLLIVSIVSGFAVGYIMHYYFTVLPMERAKKKEKEYKEKIDDEKEEKARIRTHELEEKISLLQGKMMDTSGFRKNRVAFNPKVEERQESSASSDEESEIGNEGVATDDEEEKMPPLSDRKLRQSQEIVAEPVETEQLEKRMGKLCGKLASAQLKVKARQVENQMSAEERASEAEIKAKQMESIMALMMQNKEKFGMDKAEDIQEQLNLYNF